MPVLEVVDVAKRFAGLAAVAGVSMTVEQGERRLILGPNGAGKTTFFNLLGGDLRPNTGSIKLRGQEIARFSTSARAQLGMGRTYQVLTLFENDTLTQNVVLGLLGRRALRWRIVAPNSWTVRLRREALGYLTQVGLAHLADKLVSSCSYGEKRRLELAIALSQDPIVLLLDEPFAGLSQEEREGILSLIMKLPKSLTILMIEHDMDVALTFAEKIAIMQRGQIVVDGFRDDVLADDRTREVYLGH